MRTRGFLSALVMVSFLFGCAHKSPKQKPQEPAVSSPAVSPSRPPDPAKEMLQAIQKQYRAEFEKLCFPEPGNNPALRAASMKCKGFPKTQKAIRSFASKFGTKSPEYAHLTILKGMIYLHSERFQAARAIEPEMMKAAALLCSQSSSDRLVALNYGDLVAGWSAVYKHQENLKALRAGKLFPYRRVDFKKLQLAADGIYENFLSQAAADPGITSDPQADLYGLHVAAVTAIFYTWVQTKQQTKTKNKNATYPYERGKRLIGLFLSEGEKSRFHRGQANDPGISSCRKPYLSWYAWLSSKCTKQL